MMFPCSVRLTAFYMACNLSLSLSLPSVSLSSAVAYYSKSYFHPLYGHIIDWRRNKEAVAPAPSKHSSEEFADSLIEVIEREKDDPLFMMLTLTAPHSPLQAEDRHLAECGHVKTVRRRAFCALMMSADEAVGRVKKSLQDTGKWDDTIVFFVNDNGGNVWEGGRNYPFRAGKQSSFEGGSRGTAFLKLPKSEGATPREYEGLAHISDVMPTVLGIVDRLSGSEAKEATNNGSAELGNGYDFSRPMLGLDEDNIREDVLMAYEPTTHKLGYRYKDWKIVAGNIGDNRRFLEPTSEGQWIGSGFHDMVAELMMVVNHGLDEDASGTFDEMVRETFAQM